MSDTKALHDVVEKALANWGNAEAQDALEALMGRLRDAEKEREEDQGVIRVWRGRTERAEADNAALEAMLRNLSINTRMRYAFRAKLDEVLAEEHPGAALLEELEGLRKQVASLKESVELLRTDRDAAHNAALKEAARVADSYVVRGTDRDKWVNGNAHGIATDIRALKKTGQGE